MTFAPGDAREFCIYASRYRVVFPIFLSTGLPPSGDPTGIDSEFSLDQGTFADCSNESVRILGGTTANGIFRLDLISTETTGKHVCVRVRHTLTNNTNTVLSIPIIRLPVLASGTATAAAASTITLTGTSVTDDFYNGVYVQITNNTPTNVLGMTRKIIDYVGSTKVATLDSAWGTTPSSSSTYSLLIPPQLTSTLLTE